MLWVQGFYLKVEALMLMTEIHGSLLLLAPHYLELYFSFYDLDKLSFLLFHFSLLPLFFVSLFLRHRFTALSSDNGRPLECYASNRALTKAVESAMTMSVHCECLVHA